LPTRAAAVAPEELPNLFRKYAGQAPGAGASGLGLGLAICKGIVEAHGGRIRAESAGPGTGTLVAFTLPVADDAPAAAPAGTCSPADGGRARILVVDDDPRTLRFAREALDGAGFDTMATGNFRDLARILDAERPALVLLDLVLPGSDGIELMAQVPALAELPVIFISAYDRAETLARALDAGADDYLVKPFSATELTSGIRERSANGARESIPGGWARWIHRFNAGATTPGRRRRRRRPPGRAPPVAGWQAARLWPGRTRRTTRARSRATLDPARRGTWSRPGPPPALEARRSARRPLPRCRSPAG